MYILLLFLWSHPCKSSHSFTRLGKCAAISRGQKEAVESPHRTRTCICSIQKYMHSHLVKQSHCSSDPHPHTSHSLSFLFRHKELVSLRSSVYTRKQVAGVAKIRFTMWLSAEKNERESTYQSLMVSAAAACFSHSGFNSFHSQQLWLSACVLGEVCRFTSSVQSESQ